MESSTVSKQERGTFEAKRERFFELSLDMFCIAGFDGNFKLVNPAWEVTLGFTPEELVGRPFIEFIHPDDIEATRAQYATLGQGADVVDFEHRFRCKDGSYRWLLWDARTLPDQQLIYAVAHDFTALKSAEDALEQKARELERNNTELNDFTHVVSHDLKEPLRGIEAFSGFLREDYADKLDETGRRYLDVLQHSAVSMRDLIDDLQPSLVVYPKDASYYCFGCGVGGDVIDFVSRLNGVGFRAATSMLSGASVEPRRRDDTPMAEVPSRFRAGPPTEAESGVIDAAAAFYRQSLWCSPGALSYLALRGIDRRTARENQVGYGSPGLAQHLRSGGLILDAARGVGLLSGKWETMLGRIIIADMRDGRATWLTGRTLGEATPRYMNLRLATPLLGLASVRREEAVILAEGVFDWLTLVQWGFPGVALLGTRVSKHTVETLRRFSHVYVALDSDDAGRRASAEVASALGSRATIVELPAGVHDLNDLGRSTGGRQAFERCLEIAPKGKDNKWERTEEPTARRAA